jgi:hypothetical protein
VIDHERRLIFIHIPKTAGVAVYNALGITDQPSHKTILDYAEYREDYFSFALVRNPWDRALSSYLYITAGGRGWVDDVKASKVLADCSSFEDFANRIDEYQDRLSRLPAQGNGCHLSHYPHLVPQTFWTHDIEHRAMLDFIGRYESLAADLGKVAARTGEKVSLQTVNTTDHGPYRDYYSSSSRKAIQRAYERDIEEFGYRF